MRLTILTTILAFYALSTFAQSATTLDSINTPTSYLSIDKATTSQATTEEGRSEITSVFMTSYSTANELKLISETTGWGKNHLGYAYVEVGTVGFKDRWLYTQLIWEQKFWMDVLIEAE